MARCRAVSSSKCMRCPPQSDRWRLPAGDVLDATGRQKESERGEPLSAPPPTSTMRCRSRATKAPRCAVGKTSTMRCRSADIHDFRCVRYDLSPRPLFERVYAKELAAHFSRLAAGGWTTQPAFGDLTAHRLARTG